MICLVDEGAMEPSSSFSSLGKGGAILGGEREEGFESREEGGSGGRSLKE